MSDLNLSEQRHVRTALKHLRRTLKGWASVAAGLHVAVPSMMDVVYEKRPVSASMAFRVARLADVPIDDLISGHYLPGACPQCGYVPDFSDESTTVEDGPRPAPGGGLKIVK